MAANQTIKQEKGSAGGGGGRGNAGGGGGGMMAEENTGGSPVNSPSYPGSFPDSTHSSVPFSNYDGSTNMSSMASNVYAASLNSNSGKRLMETLSSGQVKYLPFKISNHTNPY